MSWVLVLLISTMPYGAPNPRPVTIPGFTSQANCIAAGKDTSLDSRVLWWRCVEVK